MAIQKVELCRTKPDSPRRWPILADRQEATFDRFGSVKARWPDAAPRQNTPRRTCTFSRLPQSIRRNTDRAFSHRSQTLNPRYYCPFPPTVLENSVYAPIFGHYTQMSAGPPACWFRSRESGFPRGLSAGEPAGVDSPVIRAFGSWGRWLISLVLPDRHRPTVDCRRPRPGLPAMASGPPRSEPSCRDGSSRAGGPRPDRLR